MAKILSNAMPYTYYRKYISFETHIIRHQYFLKTTRESFNTLLNRLLLPFELEKLVK